MYKVIILILFIISIFSCASTHYNISGENHKLSISQDKSIELDFELNKDVSKDVSTSTELDMLNKK